MGLIAIPRQWFNTPAQQDIPLNAQIGSNTFEFLRALFRETVKSQPDWNASTEVVTGTGSTSKGFNQLNCMTGTTHASTAGRYIAVQLPTSVAYQTVNWAKKLWLAFVIQWDGTLATNLTIRLHLTQATTIGNLAAHGLGLQTNGANINLATYGTGGEQTLVSTSTNLVSGVRQYVLIEHDPASADRLYLNGVLKATQSTAANIPSTEPSANYSFFGSIARSGGADVASERIRIEAAYYGQEL